MSFRNKLLLDIGIVVCAIAICTVAILWLGGGITKTVGSIDSISSDQALRTVLLTYLGELKAEQEKAKPYVSIVQNLLPTKDKILKLPNIISTFATQDKLQGFTFTFGAEKSSTAVDPGKIAFTFSLSGTPDNFIKFMKSVEELNGYFLKINSLDVSLKEKAGYMFSISGETYTK